MTWPDPAEVHETDVDGVRTRWQAVRGRLGAGLRSRRVRRRDDGHLRRLAPPRAPGAVRRRSARRSQQRPGGPVHDDLPLHRRGADGGRVPRCGDRAAVGPPRRTARGRAGNPKAEGPGAGATWSRPDVWRYGASGYGLAGQGELGLDVLGIHDLRAWSAEVATTGNAVLWLTGPPPAGLELRLPAGSTGRRRPAPSMMPELPAWFSGPNDGVALSAVLPRGYPNQALTSILRARLVDELRTRRAVAYSPQVDYRPLPAWPGGCSWSATLVAGRQSDGVRALRGLCWRSSATPVASVSRSWPNGARRPGAAVIGRRRWRCGCRHQPSAAGRLGGLPRGGGRRTRRSVRRGCRDRRAGRPGHRPGSGSQGRAGQPGAPATGPEHALRAGQ